MRGILFIVVCFFVQFSFGHPTVRITNTSSNETMSFLVYYNNQANNRVWTGGTLGPGQTGDGVMITNQIPPGQLVWVRNASGNLRWAFPTNGLVMHDNQTVHFYWPSNTETNCNFYFPVHNNFTAATTFYAAKNLVIDMGKTLVLGPGQSGVLSFSAPCVESNQWTILWAPYGEPFELDTTPYIQQANVNPPNPNDLTPALADPPAPSLYSPTNNPPPIDFGNSTNESQTGFNALYDAISKFAAQTDNNLRRILSNSTSVSVSLTVTNNNSVNVSVTNNGNSDVTNWLSQIHNTMTNQSQVSSDRSALTNLWGTPEIAEMTDFNDMLDQFRGATVDDSIPVGSGSSFWSLDLYPGGPSFNLQPSAHLSGPFGVARKLVTWLLFMAFAGFVLKDIFDLLKLISATSQMDAPEAEATIFGVGGNWGIALAPVIVGAFLGAYAILVLAATTSMGSVFGGEDFIGIIFSGPFGSVSGAVSEGVAEADTFLPLALLVSVPCSYLIWLATKNFVAAKVVFLIKILVH